LESYLTRKFVSTCEKQTITSTPTYRLSLEALAKLVLKNKRPHYRILFQVCCYKTSTRLAKRFAFNF